VNNITLFQFFRLNSAGNTFTLCDLDRQPLAKEERPEIAKKLCTGYIGFTSDGCIFLNKTGTGSYEWDFYNSDGSHAEMCGNATRAVACFLNIKDSVMLKTRAGIIRLSRPNPKLNIYSAQWSLKADVAWEQEFNFCGHNVSYDYANTGVPHAILEMEPYVELAKDLRRHKAHHPRGMNVTFVESRSPGELVAVTFERGLEDFTLSCGTGAVAAALWSKECYPELKNHQVQMPGGNLLVTFLTEDLIELSGPSQLDFKFEVEL